MEKKRLRKKCNAQILQERKKAKAELLFTESEILKLDFPAVVHLFREMKLSDSLHVAEGFQSIGQTV